MGRVFSRSETVRTKSRRMTGNFDGVLHEINVSDGIPYHSQRNNKIVPLQACNVTSMIMALKQAGVELPDTGYQQPEDALMEVLRSGAAYNMMRRAYPWAYQEDGAIRFHPNEVHGCLAHFTNEWVGKQVVTFSTSVRLEDILRHVAIMKLGAVVSGVFDMSDGRQLNHVVSVAGVVYRGAIDSDTFVIDDVVSVIIDDPYGDYRTGYTRHQGNDVKVPLSEFNQIMKKANSLTEKWAHLIWW